MNDNLIYFDGDKEIPFIKQNLSHPLKLFIANHFNHIVGSIVPALLQVQVMGSSTAICLIFGFH